METDPRTNDPFRDKIMTMLGRSGPCAGDDFKSRVFVEVQNYSRELQETDYASDFFFRLCELIVDCQSLSVPDDSFRVMVAGLLCQPKESKSCLDEEIRELIGMDSPSFEAAKGLLKNRQCIASALNKEKTGRKGSIMVGKRNFSRMEQSDAHT